MNWNLSDARGLFLRHLAQTSPNPLGLQIDRAEGLYLFDAGGNRYLDLIGGISVCNTGHRHPKVLAAIRDQLDRYLHLMVYGELVQTPQVQYATLLASRLPPTLNTVYFTNSGAEAAEGAMKLAKRVTGRVEMVAFRGSYHGSTQGALSIMGDEYWRNAYRPLLPGIFHEEYNSPAALDAITDRTACVVAETIQAERGVCAPDKDWLRALRARCTDTGALLVLDEIQVGFGRTGSLWGFEQYDVAPDILLLGKALGGGMPLGAFVADHELMAALSERPVLGHITTFGGHPLCCAAGLAAMEVLLEGEEEGEGEGKGEGERKRKGEGKGEGEGEGEGKWKGKGEGERKRKGEGNLIGEVRRKEGLFRELLVHPAIRAVRSCGLLMAVEFASAEENKRIIDACIRNGALTDWFLFAPECMRIAPPLTIREEEIRRACEIILASI